MELDLLVPRYLSAEGKDLAQYASDTDEYIQLRDDLKTTSKELFYNFSEYSAYKDSYGLDASNIRYCYRMDQDGEVHYYTNLNDDFTDKKLDEITRQFEEYGRYLCYNADRAELLTNTEIAADKLRQELSSYQYAFGDNTRVWLAVDTTYPARDSFATARAAYHRVVPYYGYLAAAGMLFLVVSVWLLLRVTRYEGRVRKEGGGYQIELRIRDTVLTEPFVAAGILMMGMILGVSWLFVSACADDVDGCDACGVVPVCSGRCCLFTGRCVFVFLFESCQTGEGAYTVEQFHAAADFQSDWKRRAAAL